MVFREERTAALPPWKTHRVSHFPSLRRLRKAPYKKSNCKGCPGTLHKSAKDGAPDLLGRGNKERLRQNVFRPARSAMEGPVVPLAV
jgi:hypothetical protein